MKKLVFRIDDMDCAACTITIDGDLEDTLGIKKACTSYSKSVTEVEYDPEKISEKEIVKVIKNSGYTAKSQVN